MITGLWHYMVGVYSVEVLYICLCVVLTATGRMTLTAGEKQNPANINLDFGHYISVFTLIETKLKLISR